MPQPPTNFTLVFPHQLYQPNPALATNRPVVLVEETLYFNQYQFHAQKLVLHRASMQQYAQWLSQNGHQNIQYIHAKQAEADVRLLLPQLQKQGCQQLHMCTVADYWLHLRLTKAAAALSITIVWHRSPNFLNTVADADHYFEGKKKYHQTDFYVWQRKHRKLLMADEQKPLGGKWTFDTENRQAWPKGMKAPSTPLPAPNTHTAEAVAYVQQHFPQAYGTAAQFAYPTNHHDAAQWLQHFLTTKLAQFGAYEDAMVATEGLLFHSGLTPMLNIGLLSPAQIVEQTLQTAANMDIPLNSLEGFLRQIVGWREFIHQVYMRQGSHQRTANYWGFTRKIPPQFWSGTTGIPPIDTVIKKALNTGYNHHIERLMVLGNFFLLCEFDPNDVHRWFMEMYVDAYDWVMVPNVYGMTQFADGGLMTTKPYISGSNYILKMSDFAKGPWTAIWDGLFWRFMHVHRTYFQQNPRLGMLVGTFDKMLPEKREAHLQQANLFLQQLDQ
ncbi:MAG: cryptochrome/photolyase family protein [Bacteroidetes bacterium]|nr:MAG: cryptochrome/photolyase family protein [Bacteroidota bacterium]